MKAKFKIVYTSDTHGHLSAYDFITKSYGNYGLSRLASHNKSCVEPILLLDNGDFLQGSPLLDYARKNKLESPVATTFNALGYHYLTPGNHDFNFGLTHLLEFQKKFSGAVLCANIMFDGKPLFTPFVIHEITGVKIAIIGVTTEYIPYWERQEHIEGLVFVDAVSSVTTIIESHCLAEHSDMIVVLYHGGFERSLETGESYGLQTVENKAYALFQIPQVDLLLTGHQHVRQIYKDNNGRIAIQTGFNAMDAAVIDIDIERNDKDFFLNKMDASIITLENYDCDTEIESILKPLVTQTNSYLSESLGILKTDMRIHSPLEARARKHPLFQLINQIQLEITSADISCASLPNLTHGFPLEVTRNDVAVSFPFENDLIVIELTGKQLREALEQNASYFSIEQGALCIHPRFLHPKVEHYNYDVYDGISYEILAYENIGKRIRSVMVGNKALIEDELYTLALTSYRATGAGGFAVFKEAKVVKKYPLSYFELVCDYILSHPNLEIEIKENFKVKLQ